MRLMRLMRVVLWCVASLQALVRYDTSASLMRVMVNGQQLFVATAPSMLEEMNRKRGTPLIETKFLLQSTPFAIGLRKDGGRLKVFLDDWLKRNLVNGRINAIHKRFHGQDLPPELLQMRTAMRWVQRAPAARSGPGNFRPRLTPH